MTKTLYTVELGLDLWYQALQEEFGVIFNTDPDDIDSLRGSLYLIRGDMHDPRLDALAIHINADGKSIMIYKQATAVLD